jgi:large subunit ribosomal protein L21
MRYAIIQNGGKQYKAVEGQAIEVDKLELEVGKKVDLGEVLLVSDGENVMVGTPVLTEAKVAATVVSQDQGPKITVFKYKPKIRYRVKTGHRQKFTRLQIDSIEVQGLARSEAKPVVAEPEAKAEKTEAGARRRTTAEKPAAKPAAKAAAGAKPAASARKPIAKKPTAPAKKKPAAKKPAADKKKKK